MKHQSCNSKQADFIWQIHSTNIEGEFKKKHCQVRSTQLHSLQSDRDLRHAWNAAFSTRQLRAHTRACWLCGRATDIEPERYQASYTAPLRVLNHHGAQFGGYIGFKPKKYAIITQSTCTRKCTQSACMRRGFSSVFKITLRLQGMQGRTPLNQSSIETNASRSEVRGSIWGLFGKSKWPVRWQPPGGRSLTKHYTAVKKVGFPPLTSLVRTGKFLLLFY